MLVKLAVIYMMINVFMLGAYIIPGPTENKAYRNKYREVLVVLFFGLFGTIVLIGVSIITLKEMIKK